jgi:hypothetical protein
LKGEYCERTPDQLVFKTAEEFETMRPLRNRDGSCMRLYCLSKGSFWTPVSAVSEAMLRRAKDLKVESMISVDLAGQGF